MDRILDSPGFVVVDAAPKGTTNESQIGRDSSLHPTRVTRGVYTPELQAVCRTHRKTFAEELQESTFLARKSTWHEEGSLRGHRSSGSKTNVGPIDKQSFPDGCM